MTQNSKLKIKSLLEQAVRVKKPTSKPLIEETITNKKGKQLHMLWVPHNHSDPSIINETYRKITLFFDRNARRRPLSDNDKSVVFIENVPQLGRHDTKFRSKKNFPKLLKQVRNTAPNFPGENWKVIETAEKLQLPMFCPEPSQTELSRKIKQNTTITELNTLAYGFFMTTYKQSTEPAKNPFSTSLDDAIRTYIKADPESFNQTDCEELICGLKEIINCLWDGTFDFSASFFKNHKQDFETLMSPIDAVPHLVPKQSVSMRLEKDKINQIVTAIRRVPQKHGLIRDLNILEELYAAFKTNDIVYLIYGYGHRDTLLTSIQYLMER